MFLAEKALFDVTIRGAVHAKRVSSTARAGIRPEMRANANSTAGTLRSEWRLIVILPGAWRANEHCPTVSQMQFRGAETIS